MVINADLIVIVIVFIYTCSGAQAHFLPSETEESLLLQRLLNERINPHRRSRSILTSNQRITDFPAINDQILAGLADGNAFETLLVA